MSATVVDQGECMEHFIGGLHRSPPWGVRLGDVCGGGHVVVIHYEGSNATSATVLRRDGSSFELRRDA